MFPFPAEWRPQPTNKRDIASENQRNLAPHVVTAHINSSLVLRKIISYDHPTEDARRAD